MSDFPDAERRQRASGELLRVIEAGFRAEPALLAAVRDWIGFAESAPPPRPCMVCGRTLAGFVVESRPNAARLLRARTAGIHAVCGPCIYLAHELLGITGQIDSQRAADRAKPRFDMILAELDRALELLSEEDAAVARACLAARPAVVEKECGHCGKKAPGIAGRGIAALCERCAREARSTFEDTGLRSELESGDTNCPECGSHDVSAAPIGIEFTEMTCLACGHSEICDNWQLMEWHG